MSVRVRPQQLDSRYAIILPLEDIRSFLEAPGGVQSHAIVGPGYHMVIQIGPRERRQLPRSVVLSWCFQVH